MTPAILAKSALSLKQKNLWLKSWKKKILQSLAWEFFLFVSKGSDEPPKFIVLEYRGLKAAGNPLVL